MGTTPGLISILLPTRQRPKQLVRMAESVIQTASRPDLIEVVTWIDDDDRSYDGVGFDLDWIEVSGPRTLNGYIGNLSAMWNHCYDACNGDGNDQQVFSAETRQQA